MADINPGKPEDPTSTPRKWSIFRRIQPHKPYRRAHEVNMSIHDPAIRTSRIALLRAAAKNFVFLQLLFFALFCYLFGALYKQNHLINHLNVAFVDYDGGAIGGSIRSAYQALEKNSFPTLQEKSVAEYPTPSDLRKDVCKIKYWGAIYIAPGASDALQHALAGETSNYNKTNIMQYIWNEARYSALVDSDISSNLQLLANTAKTIYASQPNWTDVITTPDVTTYSTFANPWTLTSDNIQPTVQGARLVYNTLVIILILIQEFFYLGTLNQLYDAFKIYTRLNPHRIIFFRNLISITYCLIGSLCVTSAIWIFKTGWRVNGNQFVLTWMVLWLFAHLNFLTLDVFTVWLPPPFVPMALVSWLIFNVASIMVPFELASNFYLWSYAMPAHEVYQTLVDIWSGGCNPVLRYSLPILFSFEISSLILSALGIHRRCHYAIIRAEAESRAANDRLEAAVAFEKKKLGEERAKLAAAYAERHKAGVDGVERTSSDISRAAEEEQRKIDEEDRAGITSLIDQDRERLSRLRSVNFGPSFGFGLSAGNQGSNDGEALGLRKTVP